MIVASPKTAVVSPCHLPRSAGVKMSPMIASTMGIMAPPPRPWIVRNRINCVMSWLMPDSAEPNRKTIIPPMKNGRRP